MAKTCTDEQIIDAYLEAKTSAVAAKKLGISRQAVNLRIKTMQHAGVKVPQFHGNQGRTNYKPERVAELNNYIAERLLASPDAEHEPR
jgi:biotin operon repressor